MIDRFKEILDLEEMATKGPWHYAEHDEPAGNGDDSERIYNYWINPNVLFNAHDYQVSNSNDLRLCVANRNSIRPIIELLLQAEEALEKSRLFVPDHIPGLQTDCADTLQAIDKFRKGER